MRKIRILALTAIILLAAFLRAWISDFTLILLDYDAFYHARIAELIYQTHHIPTWDAGELGGIPHYYPPLYHITMVLGKYILPQHSALAIGSILTVFFGALGTLFVYLLGRRFSERIGLLSALIYALTPMMVLRSGLWARPTGLSMLLTILMVYLFLRAAERRDLKDAALALIVGTGFVFAHSSILLTLFLILAVSIIIRDNHTTKTFLKIALFSLFVGGLYYYRAIPFLNFSISNKGEYMPLSQPLLELLPFSDWGTLAVAFLFLGNFNLTLFPIVFHGIYEMLKTKKELGLLAFFSFLIIFFKANMFMLLNFTVCIAIAVSIFRISETRGKPLAILLLLMVIGTDVVLLQESQGEKKSARIDVIEEILSDAPLTSENLVMASDPNVGHAIPYYSQAGAFISDLTDTKQYDRNRGIFDRLTDENIDTGEATALLIENNIDHLLIIGEPFPFMKGSKNFVLIREIDKNGVKAYLYRLKK
jgi:4-amino-4-deoxy-L-arabinose transferase-like glycosyltransferase